MLFDKDFSSDFYTPDFPTGVGYQNYNNWEKVLESYVSSGIINENTIIYAHSIAPIFVCHFLVSHNIKVKILVFVCGFNNYLGINEEYDNVNHTLKFYKIEFYYMPFQKRTFVNYYCQYLNGSSAIYLI